MHPATAPGRWFPEQDVADRRLESRATKSISRASATTKSGVPPTGRLDAGKPNTFLDANFDPTKDWEGRHTAGYVVFKDKMWIVGGDVNQGHYHFDVWNSADGKTWTYVNKGKPVPWGPRATALHARVQRQDLGHRRTDDAAVRQVR